MELYLMQHGAAFSQEKDPGRGLTPEGGEQIRTSGQAMKKLGLSVDLIATSTKKRARQTAEQVASIIGYPETKIVETEKLDPAAPAREALDYLSSFTGKRRILIAGHLPSLQRIASELLSAGDSFTIHFENGGICRIDTQDEGRPGILRWHLPPGHLALIAGG